MRFLPVGAIVGNIVGLSVGALVGGREGDPVGIIVGGCVGVLVGRIVGALLGIMLGFSIMHICIFGFCSQILKIATLNQRSRNELN